jgi:hypothetical protein
MADVPNVVRLDTGFTINNVAAGCRTFWHYSGGTPTIATCQLWVNAVRPALVTNAIPLLTTATKLTTVRVSDLSSHLGASYQDLTITGGSRAGTAPPANCAMNINFVINNRYRGGKPRAFLPGGTTADMADAQHWTSAFATSWNTAWLAIQSAMSSVAGPIAIDHQVCVHWFKGHVANPRPSVWGDINVPQPLGTPVTDNVTAPSAQTLIGSQRRRLRA